MKASIFLQISFLFIFSKTIQASVEEGSEESYYHSPVREISYFPTLENLEEVLHDSVPAYYGRRESSGRDGKIGQSSLARFILGENDQILLMGYTGWSSDQIIQLCEKRNVRQQGFFINCREDRKGISFYVKGCLEGKYPCFHPCNGWRSFSRMIFFCDIARAFKAHDEKLAAFFSWSQSLKKEERSARYALRRYDQLHALYAYIYKMSVRAFLASGDERSHRIILGGLALFFYHLPSWTPEMFACTDPIQILQYQVKIFFKKLCKEFSENDVLETSYETGEVCVSDEIKKEFIQKDARKTLKNLYGDQAEFHVDFISEIEGKDLECKCLCRAITLAVAVKEKKPLFDEELLDPSLAAFEAFLEGDAREHHTSTSSSAFKPSPIGQDLARIANTQFVQLSYPTNVLLRERNEKFVRIIFEALNKEVPQPRLLGHPKTDRLRMKRYYLHDVLPVVVNFIEDFCGCIDWILSRGRETGDGPEPSFRKMYGDGVRREDLRLQGVY